MPCQTDVSVKPYALQYKRQGRMTFQKRMGALGLLLSLSMAVCLGSFNRAHAQSIYDNARYAAIVVDAQSGEVLYARHADSQRYPASLTKIMTLYMAFEALSRGEIKETDLIVMSRHANAQSPVKIGFRDGDTITFDAAMRLTAAYSANDLAAAIGEKLGGSEARFAAMMTIRAQELGMTQSRFVNASGLPDARQVSSARDFAILARTIMRDYPQYYAYFNVKSYEYGGRVYVNHNPVMSMPGVDGMKTGYTGAAGYNLVASQRKGDHRLITVMLGGANKNQRREHVRQLLDTGFNVIDRRNNGELIAAAQGEFLLAFASTSNLNSEPKPYTILAQSGQSTERPYMPQNTYQSPVSVTNNNTVSSESVSQSSNPINDAPVPYLSLKATPVEPATNQASAQTEPASPQTSDSLAQATGHTTTANSQDSEMRQVLKFSQSSKKEPEAMRLKATGLSADVVTALSASNPDKKVRSQENDYTQKEKLKKSKLLAENKADQDKKNKKGKKTVDPDAVWGVQVGAFKQKTLALDWLKNLKSRFSEQLAESTTQVLKTDEGWYRSRFVEMTQKEAKAACRVIDAKRLDCVIIKS